MLDSRSGQSIIDCPWHGLCDDSTEIVGRRERYWQNNHENCPKWNEGPNDTSSTAKKTETE